LAALKLRQLFSGRAAETATRVADLFCLTPRRQAINRYALFLAALKLRQLFSGRAAETATRVADLFCLTPANFLVVALPKQKTARTLFLAAL